MVPGWFIPRAGGVCPSLSLVRPSVAKRSVENECGDRFAAIAASRRSLAAMAAAGRSVLRPAQYIFVGGQHHGGTSLASALLTDQKPGVASLHHADAPQNEDVLADPRQRGPQIF